MKILVIGKPTYNIVLTQDKYLVEGSKNLLKEKYEMMGGATVYAAVLLAKWGMDVTYTGVIGADPNGQKIKTDLDNARVNTKYIELNYENKTSLNYILVNKENGSSTQMLMEMPVNLAKYKYDFIPDYIIMDGTPTIAASSAIVPLSPKSNFAFDKTSCILSGSIFNKYEFNSLGNSVSDEMNTLQYFENS